jgi:hypothetical protein
MIIRSYSNIDIIQGVIGYGNATEGITDWRLENTGAGVFNINNSSSIITPSGGTTEIGQITNSSDRYMIFKGGTSTFTVPAGGIVCDILVVGGGGGGSAGGGGGGGYIYLTNISLSSGTSYTATVGNGGTGATLNTNGNQGASSSFIGGSLSYTAFGGGGGGGNTNIAPSHTTGQVGSYGGNGHDQTTTQTYTSTQGNRGGRAIIGASGSGGGGGGSGAIGGDAVYVSGLFVDAGRTAQYNKGGQGGNGTANTITGTSIFYAGGGTAGANTNFDTDTSAQTAPLGGGGIGARANNANGGNGTDGLGGGGGGGDWERTAGARGGSGIVIIRYSTTNISIIDNGNVGIGTTPISSSSKLEIYGGVNITGIYKKNNRDIITDTSNYVLTTNNTIVPRTILETGHGSNYLGRLATQLNTRVGNTSNYIANISSSLSSGATSSVNSQWTNVLSGIHYTPTLYSMTSTPVATTIGTAGGFTHLVFTYTTETAGAGTGQTLYTINIPTGGVICDILIVGGGGGGGNGDGSSNEPGGGGAGGIVYMVNKTLNTGTYKINVGKGGNANTNGNSSTITDNNNNTLTFDSILLIGKGGGKGATTSSQTGSDGGSAGGGGHNMTNGGLGTQGNTFWNGLTYVPGGYNGGRATTPSRGGGGGGAGEIGSTDGDGFGGDGVQVSITGSSTFYAGGGNSHPNFSTTRSDGGGGTLNGSVGVQNGGNALPNTGSGGSGAYGGSPYIGGSGGSGIVILRYLSSTRNVGIGTTNPTSELHVYDDTTTNTKLTVQNNFVEPIVISPNTIGYTVAETLESSKFYRTITFNYFVNYPPDPPNTALLAWYRLDGNGLDYNPYVTKYNLETNSGTPTYSSGTSEDSFFQGRRYLVYSSSSLRNTALQLSYKAFSVALWVRPRIGNGTYIYQHQFHNTGGTLYLGAASWTTELMYGIDSYNQGAYSETLFPGDLNNWVHLVYIMNTNSSTRVYRNGVLIAINDGASTFVGTGNLQVLSTAADLSDIRIYNNGLSATEVATLYASYTNLVITDNYSVNFKSPTTLLVNGTSKTVNGAYTLSMGHLNDSMLPASGQTDIPLASTVLTSLPIKYEYSNTALSLPALITVSGATSSFIGTTERAISFTYTSDSSGLTGQTEYTFTPTEDIWCDILVVGGGGGGGRFGGGGGGGGVLFGANLKLNGGISVTIKVGDGGAGSTSLDTGTNGVNGYNSSIIINSIEYIALGGGGGGSRGGPPNYIGTNGAAGGSGGGGGCTFVGTSSLGGESNKNNYANFQSFGNSGGLGRPNSSSASSDPGHTSGGGGGAGSKGSDFSTTTGGGNGGRGKDFISYFGTNVGHFGFFAGGGGGNTYVNAGNRGYGNGGLGLYGGGGNGGFDGTLEYSADNGLVNTGGGGGGSKYDGTTSGSLSGGKGGSGFVIIRYRKNITQSSSLELITPLSISEPVIGAKQFPETPSTNSNSWTDNGFNVISKTSEVLWAAANDIFHLFNNVITSPDPYHSTLLYNGSSPFNYTGSTSFKGANGVVLYIDLGRSIILRNMRMAPRNNATYPGLNFLTAMPGVFKIYASNNSASWNDNNHSSWTEIHSQTTSLTFNYNQFTEFGNFSSINTPYRYFAMVVYNLSGNYTYLTFSEWDIFGTDNITPVIINSDYKYLSFTHSGGTEAQTLYSVNFPETTLCDILIVAGGGSGGQAAGGGGGAGGLIYLPNQNITTGIYNVFVGRGGTATLYQGGFNSSFGTNIAIGGGVGSSMSGTPPGNGGSGGGGNRSNTDNASVPGQTGGSGTLNQGNAGGTGKNFSGSNTGGGGGGGAGAAGVSAFTTGRGANGGIGLAYSITGTLTYYAGGGGGGSGSDFNTAGSGGLGGGGNGSIWANAGGNASANTGGGGGGGSAYPGDGRFGGNGGSGIVIIRYRNAKIGYQGYNIGNYNGDFKIVSSIYSSTSQDTDFMRITRDGASIYNPTGSPLWSTVSDRRIKENIEIASYDKCYESINKLELYRFNYIKELNNINKDIKQLGYIAQEVKDIFPKAVSTQEFYNDNLSISDMLSIDITQINYSLYGAVKKLIEIDNNKEMRIKMIEYLLDIDTSSNITIDTSITSNLTLNTSTTSNITVDTSNSNITLDTSTSNITVDTTTSNLTLDTSNSNITLDTTTSNLTLDTSNSNLTLDTTTSNLTLDTSITSNLTLDTSNSNITLDTTTSNITVDTTTSNLTLDTTTSNLTLDTTTSNLTLDTTTSNLTLDTTTSNLSN